MKEDPSVYPVVAATPRAPVSLAAAACAALLALGTISGCQRSDAPAPPAPLPIAGQPVEPAPAAAKRDEQAARDDLATAAGKVAKAASAAVDALQATVEDAAITTNVNGALAKDPALSALHVNVDTLDGHVKMTGQAPTVDARERATRLARAVDGVKSVDNQLDVKP
ncbi:MAG: BON domain-containing protein [Rubrivivax sp.]